MATLATAQTELSWAGVGLRLTKKNEMLEISDDSQSFLPYYFITHHLQSPEMLKISLGQYFLKLEIFLTKIF